MWLPDFRLETYFARWEFTARHNLAASDLEALSLRELLELADETDRRAWHDLRLGYTQTYGDPQLREAVAAGYEQVDAENVIVLSGAEEGIFLAMHVLLDAGDHAVVVTPTYQSVETVAAARAEVTGVALDPRRGWALDLDAVRDALRPNTRLLAINFPHNPTGAVLDEPTLRALVALCDERGVRLFSDEVYRGMEADPATTLPQAADLSPTALSLGVMSKAYGLPGLRIGWIACRDPRVLRRLERARHYTTICNSVPAEILARIALKARDRLLDHDRRIIARNLPLFEAFFAEFADRFEFAPPRGGCVCFPRYLGPGSAEQMCRDLVEQAGVLLLPPSVFASRLTPVPSDRFRIGMGRTDAEAALAAFAGWLRRRPTTPA